MSEQKGDSHATPAHDAALQNYRTAMAEENARYQSELESVTLAHEARIVAISHVYTDALAEADRGGQT